ncbi:MAG: OmpH family outer membrane protein [Syntrophales bacterium]|jgi:outer membrane protein
MKRIILLSFGVLLLIGMMSALPSSYAAEKTGFIDLREVMLTSEAGKKASDEFKGAFEANKTAIQEKETELKKLKDDLEKQRSVLKEGAYKDKEGAYQKKFRDYQLMVKDANEELQNRDQEISKKMIPDIMKVVQAIGEKEKYTLILDVSTIPVAYYNKENDLTKRVTDEFNKASKAARK